MGPAQPKNGISHQENDGHEAPQKINHPKFSNAKLINRKEDESCEIQISVPVVNESQVKNWENKLKEVEGSETIFIPISHQFSKTQFCGSSGLCNINYEDYPYLLSDQIINRYQMQNKHFEQPELWYLMYTLFEAGKQMHEKNKKIGDVRPPNVFINENGQVRVASQYSWPQQKTNYLKTAYEKEVTYLSPEQIKDLRLGKMEEFSNPAVSEAFSIGLTCLDAATLSDSHQMYKQQFNYALLDTKLNLLRGIAYSEPLQLTIQSLCSTDPETRISCSELVAWLLPYETFLLELMPFQVTTLPSKLLDLKQKNAPAPQPQYQNGYRQMPPQSVLSTQNSSMGAIASSGFNPINQIPQQFYQNNPQPPEVRKPAFQPFYQPQFQSTYVQDPNLVNPTAFQTYFPKELNQNRPIPSANFRELQTQPQVNQQIQGQKIQFQALPPQQVQSDAGRMSLQQIDEQLNRSRQMFPS